MDKLGNEIKKYTQGFPSGLATKSHLLTYETNRSPVDVHDTGCPGAGALG